MISVVARTRVSESYPGKHPVAAAAMVLGFKTPEDLIRTAASRHGLDDERTAPYITEFADPAAIPKGAVTPFFVIPFIERAFNPESPEAISLNREPGRRKRHCPR